jgi:hypothetical protein
MEPKRVVEIMAREIRAYGQAWRNDWSGFDGRQLRDQLKGVAMWGEKAMVEATDVEYTLGTEFLKGCDDAD